MLHTILQEERGRETAAAAAPYVEFLLQLDASQNIARPPSPFPFSYFSFIFSLPSSLLGNVFRLENLCSAIRPISSTPIYQRLYL